MTATTNVTTELTKEELELAKKLQDMFGNACEFIPRLRIATGYLLLKSRIQEDAQKLEGIKRIAEIANSISEGDLEEIFLSFASVGGKIEDRDSAAVEIVKSWTDASKVDPETWSSGYGY